MAHILILGGGESGRGVALLAQARGHLPFVSDAGSLPQNGKRELERAGIPFEEGGHAENVLEGIDVVVKSPGIPWTAAAVASAKARGLPVQGEMEWCAPYARGKIIGITGSNGKTTTTLLTGHLLREAGVSVAVGGNVGTSYARLLLEGGADWYVLELSSFQLEDIDRFHVDIGMVLNISPDHLDRYEDSITGYAGAKFRLKRTLRPGATWLQANDEMSLAHTPQLPPGAEQVEMPATFTGGTARTPRGEYALADTVLQGPHNAANASFALTAAELVGCGRTVLAKALRSFVNAPHRLETVGYANGVRFVNDSKATNLDAVAKALQSFAESIVWIVGGQDKGNVYADLDPLVRGGRVRAIVALGVDNAKILSAFAEFGERLHDTHALEDALQSSIMEARPGDVLLLSPACASFDLFRDYIDRGDRFRDAVRALPGFSETRSKA